MVAEMEGAFVGGFDVCAGGWVAVGGVWMCCGVVRSMTSVWGEATTTGDDVAGFGAEFFPIIAMIPNMPKSSASPPMMITPREIDDFFPAFGAGFGVGGGTGGRLGAEGA